MENILLPWVVLGMSILIIKSISCGVMILVYHVPARLWGSPPCWPQPRIPCQSPGPLAPVSGTTQQGSSQLPSVLPCQVQILSRPCPVPIPRKAPDVQRWGCPSAPSCLHLAGVAGQVLAVIALSQQTPTGSPPHPAGPRPWQIQESNTGHFFSRKIPHAS